MSIKMKPRTSPTVDATRVWLYPKSDNRWYYMGTDGVERAVVTAMPSDPVTVLTISAGVVTIDLSLGRSFTLSLTANVTSIVFTNMPAAGYAAEIEILFKQDATGSRTVTLPAAFKATGGSDTAVSAGANTYTMLSAKTFDSGTRWGYAMQEVA